MAGSPCLTCDNRWVYRLLFLISALVLIQGCGSSERSGTLADTTTVPTSTVSLDGHMDEAPFEPVLTYADAYEHILEVGRRERSKSNDPGMIGVNRHELAACERRIVTLHPSRRPPKHQVEQVCIQLLTWYAFSHEPPQGILRRVVLRAVPDFWKKHHEIYSTLPKSCASGTLKSCVVGNPEQIFRGKWFLLDTATRQSPQYLQFNEDGAVTGRTTCGNSFTSSWRQDDYDLIFGAVLQTKVGCAHDSEVRFHLNKVRHWRDHDQKLILLDRDWIPVAVLVAKPYTHPQRNTH